MLVTNLLSGKYNMQIQQVNICVNITFKMTGWWYTYPSEKYEFVSWDQYSQYMESHKIPWFQTTKQMTPAEIVRRTHLLRQKPVAAAISMPTPWPYPNVPVGTRSTLW